VDADSPTGAAGLYTSMGWTTKYVTESWHRDVPGRLSGLVVRLAQRGPQGAVDAVRREHADEAGRLLDPDHRPVVAQQDGQRLLQRGVDVDRGAEVAGADPVERLEVGGVDRVTASRRRPRVEPTKSATKSSAGGRAARPGWRTGPAAARREDRDPVAHPHGLVDVVGDQHDGLAELALQAQELVLQPDPHDGSTAPNGSSISSTGGSPPARGPRRPAALAAGELVRVAVGVRRGSRPTSSSSSRPARGGRRRLAVQQRHGHHVGDDLLVREEPDLLDDVADAAAQLDRVLAGDVLAVDLDRARWSARSAG
jgi:hypothetical protein